MSIKQPIKGLSAAGRLAVVFLCACCAQALLAQPEAALPVLKGPLLGQKIPETTPQIFAPGFISLTGTFDFSGVFSPDGTEYFFTRRVGTAQNIYFSRLEGGEWTAPAPVLFSKGRMALEPHFSPDGRTLYFGWDQPFPPGEPKPREEIGIWAVDRQGDGAWTSPRFVGPGMAVCSTSDGSLYFTNVDVRVPYVGKAVMKDARLVSVEAFGGGVSEQRFALGGVAHPCLAPDGSYVLFDNFGEHLFLSFKDSSGNWGKAIDLAKHGIPVSAGIATMSYDGKYFFFQNKGDIYWVSTAFLTKLK